MSFDVIEFYQSRKVNIAWDKQDADLMFIGYGSDDDAIARAGFLAVIPNLFFGLLLQNVSIEPLGGLMWKADAKYDSIVTAVNPGQGATPESTPPPAPPGTQPLGADYSFDISVVSEHITQSKQTIDRAGPNFGFAPNNEQAIGITQDGEVTGVDRMSPHFEWSLTRTFGYITLDYLNLLYTLTGKVNNDIFYGYPKGDVLFMGASMQAKGTENATVSYKFACQPTVLNINLRPGLVVPKKEGWQYLWVSYKNVNDVGQLTQQPFYYYVEKIYDYADFSLIGIGA